MFSSDMIYPKSRNKLKLDMCLWSTNAPTATKSNYGEICKSDMLTLPPPRGQVMSVKCKQPLDEITVQV